MNILDDINTIIYEEEVKDLVYLDEAIFKKDVVAGFIGGIGGALGAAISTFKELKATEIIKAKNLDSIKFQFDNIVKTRGRAVTDLVEASRKASSEDKLDSIRDIITSEKSKLIDVNSQIDKLEKALATTREFVTNSNSTRDGIIDKVSATNSKIAELTNNWVEGQFISANRFVPNLDKPLMSRIDKDRFFAKLDSLIKKGKEGNGFFDDDSKYNNLKELMTNRIKFNEKYLNYKKELGRMKDEYPSIQRSLENVEEKRKAMKSVIKDYSSKLEKITDMEEAKALSKKALDAIDKQKEDLMLQIKHIERSESKISDFSSELENLLSSMDGTFISMVGLVGAGSAIAIRRLYSKLK
jgi:predicted  nucleic acid-binding Zn-ribbon protein